VATSKEKFQVISIYVDMFSLVLAPQAQTVSLKEGEARYNPSYSSPFARPGLYSTHPLTNQHDIAES
jgi:hypothetical protein